MTWRDCVLGDVMTLKRGHDLPERVRKPGDVPVVSSSGVTGFHSEPKADPPGVVTGRYGTLGEVYYVQEPYWPLNTALYVVDFQGTDPRFAAHLLRHTLRNYRSDKAAVPGFDRNVLHQLQVRIPSVEQQASIASALSAYDDLIENNGRRIALLEEAARLLYREWFVHFRFPGHDQVRIVGAVPEGWVWRTFGAVCSLVGGGTPSTVNPEYWNDGDIPWYTPTDVTRNGCLALLDSERKITESGLRNSSAKVLPAGTILMTSRASVGFFGVTAADACTNQGFISILPNDGNMRMYLLLNLLDRVEEIRSHAGGSTYKEISKTKFKALQVLVPESRVLREFEKQVTALQDNVRALHSMSKLLSHARDFLLPRMMNGEIAV